MGTIIKRESKKGIRFFAQVRKRGHAPLAATFSRKTDASMWIAKIETEMNEGKYAPQKESRKHTLNDAVEKYTREVLPLRKKATQINQGVALRWYSAHFGHLRLFDLTEPRILEARAKLLAEGKAQGTIRVWEGYLSGMCAAAVRWKWNSNNPLTGMDKLDASKPRERALTKVEFYELRKMCAPNPDLLDYILLLAATGCRRNEIAHLRWAAIDWARSRFILTETKNGRPRSVALSSHALEILHRRNSHRRLDTDYIFFSKTNPQKPRDFSQQFKSACIRAGMGEICIHTLRHSFATWLAEGGASEIELKNAMGHTSASMSARYTHLTTIHSAGAVQALADRILEGGV